MNTVSSLSASPNMLRKLIESLVSACSLRGNDIDLLTHNIQNIQNPQYTPTVRHTNHFPPLQKGRVSSGRSPSPALQPSLLVMRPFLPPVGGGQDGPHFPPAVVDFVL